MPEFDVAMAELIATLQQARAAVQAELRMLPVQGNDRQAALRLLEATRSFADQAEALVFMLTDKGSTPALLVETNELASAFWQAEETIEAMLGLNKRSAT